jgi:hypothetical protein
MGSGGETRLLPDWPSKEGEFVKAKDLLELYSKELAYGTDTK